MGSCPGSQQRAKSPDRWAPTFLELDLKDVRAVGGFGGVLGLCVEAWRRLVLTKDRKRLEDGVSGAEPCPEVPAYPAPHLPQRSALLPQNQGLWHLPLTDTDPWASPSPARSRPPLARGPPSPQPEAGPLARGLGNKGLKKSDNFSPQLDLIFFFDAPTAGGRIAAEEQVRQEKCEFGGARQPWASGERALALPGAGKWGLFCTDRKANDYA